MWTPQGTLVYISIQLTSVVKSLHKTEVAFLPALLVQLTPSPSKPAMQVHSKLPIVSLQVAFIWQLSISRSHSLMSVNKMITWKLCIDNFLNGTMQEMGFVYIVHGSIHTCSFPTVLLVQLTPSPSKPAMQAHSKLPKVLLQAAFSWQLSISISHSLMSIKTKSHRY